MGWGRCCLPACLPVFCLSACLSVCLPVCLSVCLSVCIKGPVVCAQADTDWDRAVCWDELLRVQHVQGLLLWENGAERTSDSDATAAGCRRDGRTGALPLASPPSPSPHPLSL